MRLAPVRLDDTPVPLASFVPSFESLTPHLHTPGSEQAFTIVRHCRHLDQRYRGRQSGPHPQEGGQPSEHRPRGIFFPHQLHPLCPVAVLGR